MAVCTFASCGDDGGDIIETPPQLPITDVATAKPSALSFEDRDNAYQNITIIIDEDEEWMVGSNNSWITAKKISGKYVEITVQDNHFKSSREGSVFVIAANYSGSMVIPITQEGDPLGVMEWAGEYSVKAEIVTGGFLQDPGNTEWDVTFTAKKDEYGNYISADNWAGMGVFGCFLELSADGESLKFDSKSHVSSAVNGTVAVYIMFGCIYNSTSLVLFEPGNNPYETGVWNEDEQTLTFEPGYYEKDGKQHEVFVFAPGFSIATGGYVTSYSEAYRKMVFTKNTTKSDHSENMVEQSNINRERTFVITPGMRANAVFEEFDPARHTSK